MCELCSRGVQPETGTCSRGVQPMTECLGETQFLEYDPFWNSKMHASCPDLRDPPSRLTRSKSSESLSHMPRLYKNTTCSARVTRVLSGNTVDIIFFIDGDGYQWRCKLYGLYTPRVKDLNRKLTKFVRDELQNQQVTIVFKKFDSKGNMLIDIYHAGVNVNSKLISLGYAQPRNGPRGENPFYELELL